MANIEVGVKMLKTELAKPITTCNVQKEDMKSDMDERFARKQIEFDNTVSAVNNEFQGVFARIDDLYQRTVASKGEQPYSKQIVQPGTQRNLESDISQQSHSP